MIYSEKIISDEDFTKINAIQKNETLVIANDKKIWMFKGKIY